MVLIEALSVVVKVTSIESRYGDGLAGFRAQVPNATYCSDGELARVGFMTPADVEAFVRGLEATGLRHDAGGAAQDLVVVDQLRGPTLPAPWLEVLKAGLEQGEVKVARLRGSRIESIAVPHGWHYERSLSSTAGYVPLEHLEKAMEYLGTEGGLDVYRSKLTGGKLYAGRTKPGRDAESERERIAAIANRALELEAMAQQSREKEDEQAAALIFEELQGRLLSEVRRLAAESAGNKAFANFAVGLVLRVLHRYEEAIQYYEQSLESSPNVSNTLLEITLCYAMLERPAEAEPYARRAVKADPESAAAWGNLATTLIELRRKSEARSALDRALSLDPSDEKNRYVDENFERYFAS